jgi:hypothetical protein
MSGKKLNQIKQNPFVRNFRKIKDNADFVKGN